MPAIRIITTVIIQTREEKIVQILHFYQTVSPPSMRKRWIENFSEVSGGCLNGVWRMSGGFLEHVWRFF